MRFSSFFSQKTIFTAGHLCTSLTNLFEVDDSCLGCLFNNTFFDLNLNLHCYQRFLKVFSFLCFIIHACIAHWIKEGEGIFKKEETKHSLSFTFPLLLLRWRWREKIVFFANMLHLSSFMCYSTSLYIIKL